jgi:hypothetical protein
MLLNHPPAWMANYARSLVTNRVAQKAAWQAGQIGLQLEINKSKELIGIEERYRNDQIKRAQRGR